MKLANKSLLQLYVFCLSKKKKKREKVFMKTNDGERLVRKPEKHIRHLVLNVRDLPRHLAFDLAFEPEVVWATPLQLELLRHCLAFASIRRAGQRASDLSLIHMLAHSCAYPTPTPWQHTHRQISLESTYGVDMHDTT